jgi:hypothetical protein
MNKIRKEMVAAGTIQEPEKVKSRDGAARPTKHHIAGSSKKLPHTRAPE